MGRAIRDDVRIGSRIARRYLVFGCVDAIYSGERIRVRLHDMSWSGLRVETERPHLRPGDWLRIMLPVVGERLCQVMWCKGALAGAELADRLNLDDLTGLLDVLREAAASADASVHRAD